MSLCNDNICSLADNFLTAGFTPVIDWIVPDADQLDVFRAALGSRLRLVVLLTGGLRWVCILRGSDSQETKDLR